MRSSRVVPPLVVGGCCSSCGPGMTTVVVVDVRCLPLVSFLFIILYMIIVHK